MPILDDSVIAEAVQHARVLGCPPTGRRCSFVPRTPEAALEALIADGWCHVGSIIDVRRYSPACDVWFRVDTGEVRREPIV